jgi:pimeloyl-ACP methyl ester carboxylesterase
VVSIDDRLLDWVLFDALYAKETRDLIPVTLREAAGADNTVLLARVREFLARELPDSSAVYLSHVCHDETPFESPAAVAAAVERAGPQAHLIRETWDGFLCDIWPAGRADPVEATPVESDVPTLLLAGAYDPITRASLAEAAATHLANGYVFELARAGHGVLYESPCAKRLTAAFLADPRRRPRDVCPRGRILTPAEARAGLDRPFPGPPGGRSDGPPGPPVKAPKNGG